MRVMMLVPGVLPHFTGGGVAESGWAIMAELRARGHQVMAVIEHPGSDVAKATITAIGGEYAEGVKRENLDETAGAWKPDAFYSLAVSCLAPPTLLPDVPRLCVVGDLDHHVPLYRRQYYARAVPMNYPELAGLHNQAMQIKAHVMQGLRQCDVVVASCCHHSQWLEQQGVPNTYIPAPGFDPMGKGWVRPPESYPNNPVPTISMAGHLRGIATLSGLYFLAEDVLPWLRLSSPEGLDCRIRIAGAETLYADVATRLMPYMNPLGPVQMVGYVEDIHAEMMGAEISLVTTPIDLGVRTRVIDCLALSCCLVVHKANLAGFAEGELVHGHNCLVGSTGRELAALVKQAAADPALRVELGRHGRDTYEKYHMGAAARTVDLLEAMAAEPRGRLGLRALRLGKDQVSTPGADPRVDTGRPLNEMGLPFHGDEVLLEVIDSIVTGRELRLFIETGTEAGTGTAYMAETYPALQCWTCESHLPTYLTAVENLKHVKDRVSIFAGTSVDFLDRFRDMMPYILEQQALFWLDAHSHGFGSPLREEVAFITKHWRGGYILCDDFQVPGHPDFEYDTYEIGPLSWDLIKDSLGKRVHQVWWPGYKAPAFPHGRGWVLLVFGDVQLWQPSGEMAGQMWESPELLSASVSGVLPVPA